MYKFVNTSLSFYLFFRFDLKFFNFHVTDSTLHTTYINYRLNYTVFFPWTCVSAYLRTFIFLPFFLKFFTSHSSHSSDFYIFLQILDRFAILYFSSFFLIINFFITNYKRVKRLFIFGCLSSSSFLRSCSSFVSFDST